MPGGSQGVSPEEDAVAKAYAAISNQLETWTSPRLSQSGKTPMRPEAYQNASPYPSEAVDWMDQENLQQQEHDTPHHREMPDNPVVDNSSSKASAAFSPLELPQTSTPLTPGRPAAGTSLFTTATQQAHEYRRYQEILLTYLTDRRQFAQRWELSSLDGNNNDREQLVKEERQIELDYLSNLAATCASMSYDAQEMMETMSPQDDDMAWLEGNVWSLMVALRGLGCEFLLWGGQDDADNVGMETDETKLVTPAQLVRELYESRPSLQRRRAIRSWLQQCRKEHRDETTMTGFSNAALKRTMWSDSLQQLSLGTRTPSNNKITRLDPDAPLLVSDRNPLHGRDQERDQELLEMCLGYMLAGRMDQAFTLCQQYGQPWRCATWSGGAWQDVVPSNERIGDFRTAGNSKRMLWKRTCWQLAESPSLRSPHESAIFSLLSNHLKRALSNVALRSWESALYACVDASLQRAEEEHVYGKLAANAGLAEREHLQATVQATSMCRNEASMLEAISTSPFEEVQIHDPLRAAMASFLVGHQAVLSYVLDEGGIVNQTTPEAQLRFLTHLILYLDSLSASTAPPPWQETMLDSVKNNILLQYLENLASHPDLWRLMALYASLLPTDLMLEFFPSMLVPIEDERERAALVEQMAALFPAGVDIIVLRLVVQLLLNDENRQLRSITWMCKSKEHRGEALMSTNTLLRHLLLGADEDLTKALLFFERYLPEAVLSEMQTTPPEEQGDSDNLLKGDSADQLNRARLEFGALICYLEAHKAFVDWKRVMEQIAPTVSIVGSSFVADKSGLNTTEIQIAKTMEKREFLNRKREASRQVVEAADKARNQLVEVLTFDGGWLLCEDDDGDDQVGAGSSEQEQKRISELNMLHTRYLPKAVSLLQILCDETATWMETSLEDAKTVLGENALAQVDGGTQTNTSPLSPIYWIDHALSLASMVASEENRIYAAFGEEERQYFLLLAAEMEVRELQLSHP